MKNGRKPTVNKENGELFETVFGKDMKDKNVEYSDKKEHIIKSMLNSGNNPLGLRIVSSIFNYLQLFFTVFLPISLLVSICMKTPNIIDILKILGLSVSTFCVLKIVEFLISAFMIWIYSNILTSLSGRTAVLQERIKSHLKTEDAKNNQVNKADVSKTEENLDPENSPLAMAKTVNRLVELFISEKRENIDISKDNLIRIVMNILFNIYKQGYNGKDDIPKTVLGPITYPLEEDIFDFIIEVAKTSDWFKKPF